jgi:hypothetical protein
MLLRSTIIATFVGLASAAASLRGNSSDFHTRSQDNVNSFAPYSNYAAAAKCEAQKVVAWTCGGACLTCDPFFFPAEGEGWAIPNEPVLTSRFPCPAKCMANPSFQPIVAGGDGNRVQYCAHVHQAVNFLFLVICMLTLSNRVRGL